MMVIGKLLSLTSLGIDLDRLDQLAPLRDLTADALAERSWRAAARIDAVAAEALDQLRRAHRALAWGGELLDPRCGRPPPSLVPPQPVRRIVDADLPIVH